MIDRGEGPVTLPPDGLLMSAALARWIGVRAGDRVTVEVLEGRRPREEIVVSALVDDMLGLSAWIEAGRLARMLKEDRNLSGAFLSVDPASVEALYATLKETPGVGGVSLASATIRSFRETIRANMLRIILFNVLFSVIIAVGVVYNAARISLSERSRDLASLRVLGFSRAEI